MFNRKKSTMTDTRRFIIVGASLADAKAAETLRQDGFEGDLDLKDNLNLGFLSAHLFLREARYSHDWQATEIQCPLQSRAPVTKAAWPSTVNRSWKL